MPAVRQKAGPILTCLLAQVVESKNRCWRSARGGDALEWPAVHSKHNNPIAIPRSATRALNVTKSLRKASRYFYFLQLVITEKPEITTVRRPEREHCIFSASQSLRGDRIQRSRIVKTLSPQHGDERQTTSVG